MISYLGPAYAPDTWSEDECAIPVYDTKEDEIKGRVGRLLLMVKRRDTRIKELEREIASLTYWQPIETAPKDGSVILLWFANKPAHVRTASWELWPDQNYPEVWQDVSGDCICRPWKNDIGPTHWGPLPEPPK